MSRANSSGWGCTVRCRGTVWIALLVLAAWLGAVAPGLAQEPAYRMPAGVSLKPGATRERTLHEGEVHVYRVAMEAGHFLQAVVDQKEVNVTVLVAVPGQASLNHYDRRFRGPERFRVLARISGVCEVAVVAPLGRDRQGVYAIRVEALRPPGPRDRLAAEAARHAIEGYMGYEAGTDEGLGLAARRFSRALELWQSLGDRKEQAFVLYHRGMVHWKGKRYGPARADFGASHAVGEALSDPELMIRPLFMRAVVACFTNPKQAATELRAVLPLARKLGKSSVEAGVHWQLGRLAALRGELEAARDAYQCALGLWEREDYLARASTWRALWGIYLLLGDRTKMAECQAEARKTIREGAAIRPHDPEDAFVLAIHEKLDQVLAHVGGCASPSLMAQLEVLENLHETVMKGGGSDFGPADASVEYGEKALQTAMALGVMKGLAGDLNGAVEDLERLRSRVKKQGTLWMRACLQAALGELHARLDQPDKAVDHLEQALERFGEMACSEGEAGVRYHLARVLWRQGQAARALHELEAALKDVEKSRVRVTHRMQQLAYFAKRHDFYALGMAIHLALAGSEPDRGHVGAAFDLFERSRARALLDSLGASASEIRKGVPPELLEKEHTLRHELEEAELARLQARSRGAPAEQVASAVIRARELTRELADAEAAVCQASPRYAAFTRPAPLTPAAIQHDVLDPDTALLAFHLAEPRSVLWVVTPESITHHALPGRAALEKTARDALRALTERSRMPEGEKPVARARRINSADEAGDRALARLSDMLLGPVQGRLGSRRLAIVAEGVLQCVPFAALPVPSSGKPDASRQPLVAGHEIVYLPSASTLAAVRLARRTDPARPDKLLAILADPVVDPGDPRLAHDADGSGAGPEEKPDLKKALRGVADGAGVDGEACPLARLLGSRREAEVLASLVRDQGASMLLGLGFAASREKVIQGALEPYRFIHFGTHAFLDPAQPDRSCIVLSLLEPEGEVANGFLRLHEIYNLELTADLVTLGCCRSALGRPIPGEGLVGLVRGFMFAGVPRVAGNLWDVRDDRAAALTCALYRGLLGEAPASPAAALRAAQLALLEEPGARPYHWAAGVLWGDWR